MNEKKEIYACDQAYKEEKRPVKERVSLANKILPELLLI